jgi:4-diphosphocytidyl-2-C-methyl-D-erythritol kinase
LILTCDNPQVPVNEENLIIQAAHLLKKKYGVKRGAKIHLEKNIPSPGGLGGGSSDAAVALMGLVKLWNLKIEFSELCEIGAALGSDVPFFFYGGTALGSGRGTEISPIGDRTENFMLIVTPKSVVPTDKAFALLNAPRLTNLPSKSILKICRNEAERQYFGQSDLSNDFERVVFKIEPEIERVKKRLLELGARSALMSGSGSSVYCIIDNEETRQAILKAIEDEQDWRKFAVATISRESYREKLKVVSD